MYCYEGLWWVGGGEVESKGSRKGILAHRTRWRGKILQIIKESLHSELMISPSIYLVLSLLRLLTQKLTLN